MILHSVSLVIELSISPGMLFTLILDFGISFPIMLFILLILSILKPHLSFILTRLCVKIFLDSIFRSCLGSCELCLFWICAVVPGSFTFFWHVKFKVNFIYYMMMNKLLRCEPSLSLILYIIMFCRFWADKFTKWYFMMNKLLRCEPSLSLISYIIMFCGF